MTAQTSRFLLFGLTFATCLYLAEIPLTNVLLPEIAKELGGEENKLQIISTSYGFAVAMAVLCAGWLGDKIGIRPVILAGIIIFSIGCLIPIIPSFEALVLGRLMQGIGGGLFSPLIPVALVQLAPKRPGRSLALWNCVIGLVTAFAPFFAIPIVNEFGWRGALVALGISSLAAVVIILFSQKNLGGASRSQAVERRRPSGSRILLPPLMAYVALNYGAVLLFLFWAPLQIQRMGMPPILGAAVLSVTWVFFSVVGYLIRRGIDTEHVVSYLVASPIVILMGWFLFTSMGTGPTSAYGLLLGSAVIGAGLGLGNAPSTLLILKHAPAGRSSLAVSLDVSFARLGSVLVIWLLGDVTSADEIIAGVTLICVLNALCALPNLYWSLKLRKRQGAQS